jgi:LysM repeat protein
VAGIRYTVQPGDTLSSIAHRFRVTVDAIALANGLGDPDYIFVGQVLVIPGVLHAHSFADYSSGRCCSPRGRDRDEGGVHV